MAGAFGFEKQKYDLSMAIGELDLWRKWCKWPFAPARTPKRTFLEAAQISPLDRAGKARLVCFIYFHSPRPGVLASLQPKRTRSRHRSRISRKYPSDSVRGSVSRRRTLAICKANRSIPAPLPWAAQAVCLPPGCRSRYKKVLPCFGCSVRAHGSFPELFSSFHTFAERNAGCLSCAKWIGARARSRNSAVICVHPSAVECGLFWWTFRRARQFGTLAFYSRPSAVTLVSFTPIWAAVGAESRARIASDHGNLRQQAASAPPWYTSASADSTSREPGGCGKHFFRRLPHLDGKSAGLRNPLLPPAYARTASSPGSATRAH